ncbi:hypothetical protein GQ607_004208 [Colletotrichum asianum]|uniref:Uncharacterized protein n=1 Tax=Colletotrichum asianum TaxID=702518 RepID=A0A8H3WPU3_9PEZI|nr:hypothetical protein GQ607_004208 [Colletotrichum asianum]
MIVSCNLFDDLLRSPYTSLLSSLPSQSRRPILTQHHTYLPPPIKPYQLILNKLPSPNSKISNLKPQPTRHVDPNSPPNNLLLALSRIGLKARPACSSPAIPKAQNPAGLCPRTHLHGTPPPPHERQNSDCGCWATHKRRRHGRAFMRCWVRAGVLHRSRWWPDGEAGNRCLGTLVPGGLDLCAVLGPLEVRHVRVLRARMIFTTEANRNERCWCCLTMTIIDCRGLLRLCLREQYAVVSNVTKS